MRTIPLSGQNLEVVPLGEARQWLRYETVYEDGTILMALTSARQVVEQATRCHLLTQRWRLVADEWPRGLVVALPLNPVQSIDAVRVYDAAGTAIVVPAATYRLSRSRAVARLKFDAVPPSPGITANGIEIDVTTGFGTSSADVPGPLRQAIRLLVARWFDNRGDIDAGVLPADVSAILALYRPRRLA